MKKYTIFLLSCLLLCINSCQVVEKNLEVLKKIDFNTINTKLIIYGIPPWMESNIPFTKRRIKRNYFYKIETRYIDLNGYKDLLEELKKIDYTPLKKKYQPNYHLYCEIYRENWFLQDVFHREQLIMSFCCGSDRTIVINDSFYIKYNDVFYKLVEPFIPERFK